MTSREAHVLAQLASTGDDWQRWRAARLRGEGASEAPPPPGQEPLGGFSGRSGRTSPGSTGEALCHLIVLGLGGSGEAAIAADWLEGARTPAGAWLDAPDDVPGELDNVAAGRVWATASAACGLLAMGRDPGHRAMDLLRGEADLDGRFTGGAYPTFAAAAAYWLGEGPKTEIAEWGLRWAREAFEEWWGPPEWATALTFWAAAGIPAEHASVESFLESLTEALPEQGWHDDPALTLRALEIVRFFETP